MPQDNQEAGLKIFIRPAMFSMGQPGTKRRFCVLGFLSRYYSVYDLAQNRIGFAFVSHIICMLL